MTEPDQGGRIMSPNSAAGASGTAPASGSVSVDLDALRTLAEQAQAREELWPPEATYDDYDLISACSPEVVLALIGAVQAAEWYRVCQGTEHLAEDADRTVRAGHALDAALAPFVRASTEGERMSGRGICWKCGRKVRLRKDGTLGAHGEVVTAEGIGEFIVHCSATGTRP